MLEKGSFYDIAAYKTQSQVTSGINLVLSE